MKCQIEEHFEPTIINDHKLVLHFEIQQQKNNSEFHQIIH
jgi:hypothetical protein